MATWIFTASGSSDNPDAHVQLAHEVAAVLADPEYGTGSSDFNSAYYAQPNFHTALAGDLAIPGPAAGDGGGHAGAADDLSGGQSNSGQ